jgi:hypothetical protein
MLEAFTLVVVWAVTRKLLAYYPIRSERMLTISVPVTTHETGDILRNT